MKTEKIFASLENGDVEEYPVTISDSPSRNFPKSINTLEETLMFNYTSVMQHGNCSSVET